MWQSQTRKHDLQTVTRHQTEILQTYLNEFCYKFHYRYFWERLFNRPLVVAITYSLSFKSQVYNSNIATT